MSQSTISSTKEALLIFIKNPEKGKVKTRLAKTIGEERALTIYLYLLNHTRTITSKLSNCDKFLFYSNYLDNADEWSNTLFEKYLQQGTDLGARMQIAFEKVLAKGYEKVMIIGSDCAELNTPILADAWTKLQQHDAVIGPAKDGGYYLLGMKKLPPNFFQNMEWSTSSVYEKTIKRLSSAALSYAVLPTLSDIDHEADLASLPDDLLL